MRTFIAIELPPDVIALIQTVQHQLKSHKLDVKWVKPQNIHLTLRFLGDITAETVASVEKAMAGAVKDIPPFLLTPKGLGAFPGFNRPRVLWMGLDGDLDVLNNLYQRLEEQLEALGFEKEKRPYSGHLTLGRAKGKLDPIKMVDIAGQYKGFSADAFRVKDVILFKSDLKPTGAVYEKRYSAALNEKTANSGGQT